MNSKPHTHTPRLERRWSSLSVSWDNYWQIAYGDTEVKVCRGNRMPTPKQVRKATLKAIAQHDAGSVWAGEVVEGLRQLQKEAEQTLSQWGQTGKG